MRWNAPEPHAEPTLLAPETESGTSPKRFHFQSALAPAHNPTERRLYVECEAFQNNISEQTQPENDQAVLLLKSSKRNLFCIWQLRQAGFLLTSVAEVNPRDVSAHG